MIKRENVKTVIENANTEELLFMIDNIENRFNNMGADGEADYLQENDEIHEYLLKELNNRMNSETA